ncbi:MAG: hypothetical protein WBK72_06455 [Bacillota bacterium]
MDEEVKRGLEQFPEVAAKHDAAIDAMLALQESAVGGLSLTTATTNA